MQSCTYRGVKDRLTPFLVSQLQGMPNRSQAFYGDAIQEEEMALRMTITFATGVFGCTHRQNFVATKICVIELERQESCCNTTRTFYAILFPESILLECG